ncbi:MAG TPA: glycosyltransferase [Candidatus Obscuribacterales bacterium]
MRKLRILKISHTAALASYRARERALVSQFPVEMEVVTPKHWSHLGLEQEDDSIQRFGIHRVQTIGTGNIPLFAFEPAPIAGLMRQFKPDIVDVHEEPYSVSGFESIALARRFVPQASLLFYTAQNMLKRYPPPFKWTEQFVYRCAAAAYPCSAEAEQVLRRKGFRGITRVLPLGVDRAKFNPQVLTHDERRQLRGNVGLDGFVFGYFGRVEGCKGIQFLFESMSMLPSDLQCSLAIVGSGGYRRSLESFAQSLGISQRVRWLGEKPASDMPRWISLCDAVVIPSLTTPTWKEQFGRVAVEAMACGVPVIASDSGSLPEVIAHAGMVAPEADPDKLKECLLRVMTDERLRQLLIEEGLALVDQRYLWSRVAQQTFDLYLDIAGTNAATGPPELVCQAHQG